MPWRQGKHKRGINIMCCVGFISEHTLTAWPVYFPSIPALAIGHLKCILSNTAKEENFRKQRGG
jgi:hypothetical protein